MENNIPDNGPHINKDGSDNRIFEPYIKLTNMLHETIINLVNELITNKGVLPVCEKYTRLFRNGLLRVCKGGYTYGLGLGQYYPIDFRICDILPKSASIPSAPDAPMIYKFPHMKVFALIEDSCLREVCDTKILIRNMIDCQVLNYDKQHIWINPDYWYYKNILIL